VPESPVFEVTAQSPDPRRAVQVAGAAPAALDEYVSSTIGRNAAAEQTFKDFQAAALQANRATARRLEAQRAVDEGATARRRARLVRARSAEDAARLRMDTLRQDYQEQQGGVGGAGSVQVLSPALDAISDRSSFLQRIGFLGLLAGAALGAALATVRANLGRT
jgi:hypothetical protein